LVPKCIYDLSMRSDSTCQWWATNSRLFFSP
jgi:hypothetical protein